jgi:hypothetical protein
MVEYIYKENKRSEENGRERKEKYHFDMRKNCY